LPVIRSRVRSLARSPARLTGAARVVTITAGANAEVSGALRMLSGEPLAGAPVELQSLGPKGPPASPFETLTTAEDGSWSGSVNVEQNTLVRPLHRPFPASVGNWIEVLVAPAITL